MTYHITSDDQSAHLRSRAPEQPQSRRLRTTDTPRFQSDEEHGDTAR